MPEPPNGIRRLNLKRPLRACDPVPEGTCQFEAGISNPWWPPNGIRRLNLKRPLRAYSPVPEGTCQSEAGISNPWPG